MSSKPYLGHPQAAVSLHLACLGQSSRGARPCPAGRRQVGRAQLVECIALEPLATGIVAVRSLSTTQVRSQRPSPAEPPTKLAASVASHTKTPPFELQRISAVDMQACSAKLGLQRPLPTTARRCSREGLQAPLRAPV